MPGIRGTGVTFDGGADNGNFGDGSDGDVTLGSDTTITRHMLYGTLSTSTFDIKADGYGVFAKTKINVQNSGVIHNDGVTTPDDNPGVAANSNAYAKGSDGATGGTGAGAASTAVTDTLGGRGGNGGAGSGGAGGTSGTVTAPGATLGTLRAGDSALLGRWSGLGGTGFIKSGSGGAAGGGSGTFEGGGGGGGGGVLVIAAPEIEFTGTGIVSVKGGGGGGGVADNCGGGGGGGGGVLFVLCNRVIAANFSASGGALGTAGTGGTNGVAGSAGAVIRLVTS
jgi:hypothetical protein